MADSIEELRAEIDDLKRARFAMEAQIWALGDFFRALTDALSVAGKTRPDLSAARAEFMRGLRDLYAQRGDPEEQVQRVFRTSVFDEL